MSVALVVDEITREDQRRAADPDASAWVSANAGAGKTKVLTDRVLRLLLAGSPPGRILCLTFTKAAAANMAVRVFERLGRWVTLDGGALAAELADLEGRRPDPERLRRARRLFAQAVEAPGGLRIETLHAFCERLLHLAPFEANVPARFAVLDENQVAEAVAAAFSTVLADAADPRQVRLNEALRVVGVEAAGEALRGAVLAAMRCRAVLAHEDGPDAALRDLDDAFALAPGETVETLEAGFVGDDPAGLLARASALRTGKATDEKQAAALQRTAESHDEARRREHYRTVFFNKDGEPKADKTLGTQAVPPGTKDWLRTEQARLVALDDRIRGAGAVRRTRALFTLAAEIHRRVEEQKARLGALDFDDLIVRTLDLLSRVDASFVLYKLDRGIDHILIDEAQDTNPQQWEILRKITADFTAGEGARAVTRTRFAVGDPKQSIYSFQGAAPRQFEETRLLWQRETVAASLRFEDVGLTLSFRSVSAVLSAVDATFALPAHHRGLAFGDALGRTTHRTARPRLPGVVELWPVARPEPVEEPRAWTLPVDAPEPGSPAVVTAGRVARAILAWTIGGDEGGRVWRPGEILVLVRKRSAAFEAVIRALKSLGVPVAGQDRLDVAAHIAVLDLVAAGRAALLPHDDLTLATALKSPLVGLTDEDLERIAARRDEAEPLAEALERHAREGDPAAAVAVAALALWRGLAREHGPFGFYAHLMGPGGGRSRLVARLGSEAADAIDVFLCAAHEAEGGADAPALTTFLSRYEPGSGRAAGHTVKRDLEGGRDEVRVMTVHGAKGLEAPLVVVVDGCERPGRDPPLLPLVHARGTLPVWSPGRSHDGGPLAAARRILHDAAGEEHNRLLYVAMTRAADRLVIAPYCAASSPLPETAWCEMIRRGLLAERALEEVPAPHGPVLLWRDGEGAGAGIPPAEGRRTPHAAPAWLHAPAAVERPAVPPLRPSSALGAADAPRRVEGRLAEAGARRRGILVHALLEHLPGSPPETRERAAGAFVAARAGGLDEGTRRGIVTAALAVLDHPGLAPLFGPLSRGEVALAGEVVAGGHPRPVFGRVDRLAVLPDRVIVADYKTGAPGLDDRAVLQLALYREVLAALHPGRPVEALLVWTEGPRIERLDPARMAAALAGLAAVPREAQVPSP